MTRFEQLVVSNQKDRWKIPRVTGSTIVSTDDIVQVEDCTVDTTYQSFFDERCPAGIFAAIRIHLHSGPAHTILIGQFTDEEEAAHETNTFTRWLTGRDLIPVPIDSGTGVEPDWALE